MRIAGSREHEYYLIGVFVVVLTFVVNACYEVIFDTSRYYKKMNVRVILLYGSVIALMFLILLIVLEDSPCTVSINEKYFTQCIMWVRYLLRCRKTRQDKTSTRYCLVSSRISKSLEIIIVNKKTKSIYFSAS